MIAEAKLGASDTLTEAGSKERLGAWRGWERGEAGSEEMLGEMRA